MQQSCPECRDDNENPNPMVIEPQPQRTVMNYCDFILMHYAICDPVQVEEISDEKHWQQPEAQFFKKQAQGQQDHCSHKEQKGSFHLWTCHRLQIKIDRLQTLIVAEKDEDQEVGCSIIEEISEIALGYNLLLKFGKTSPEKSEPIILV
jgi:hypothetical protein